jgi:hypothetical protein
MKIPRYAYKNEAYYVTGTPKRRLISLVGGKIKD